ncbi:hypothetical protein ACONDI_01976 [Natranaerofaba carboxydovora]|nr:hypothetical protein ACONDI_01976 [Natranaerofaba carboxydovora]
MTLTSKIQNDIASITNKLAINKYILDKISSQQRIQFNYLEELERNFSSIYGFRRPFDLARTYLNRGEPPNSLATNSYPIIKARNFSVSVKNMLDDFNNEDKTDIKLEQEEIEKIEYMKRINQLWLEVIAENIYGVNVPEPKDEYYKTVDEGRYKGTIMISEDEGKPIDDEYRNHYIDENNVSVMVTTEDWINMIEEMQTNSYKYHGEYQSLFK